MMAEEGRGLSLIAKHCSSSPKPKTKAASYRDAYTQTGFGDPLGALTSPDAVIDIETNRNICKTKSWDGPHDSLNPEGAITRSPSHHQVLPSCRDAPSQTGSPTSSPGSLTVYRRRASTKTLLDIEGQELTNEPPMPPMPPMPSKIYGKTKLREGLSYAEYTLRNAHRKLSPIGERALFVYKDACKRLLDLENQLEDLEEGEVLDYDAAKIQELKAEWCASIRTYEEAIQYRSCLKATTTSSAQELQEKLVELLQILFFARYGDMFAEACKLLRTTAEAKKIQGWQSMSKAYWTEICEKLSKEGKFYADLLKTGKGWDMCPIHMTIYETCTIIGFNFNDILAIIKLYARRNELMHSNLQLLIKEGKPWTLAKRLHDDFCDLPNIVPPSQVGELRLMQQLISTVIDLWFTRETNEDQYERWVPTKRLHDMMESYAKIGPSESISRWKTAIEDVTKALRKRLRDDQNVKDRAADFNETFQLLVGNKNRKRVASSQLDYEIERVQKRGKQWSKIVSLMENTRKMSDSYIEEWGELTPPPVIVHDPCLDD